jgi:hypothetical protein
VINKKKKVSKSQSSNQSTHSASVADQSISAGPVLDPKFKDGVCYNCGVLGHYVGPCTRLKKCFICSRPGHHIDLCPMWYTTISTSQYRGSANPGLGFFHVDVEGHEAVQWLNMDNVGIVVINDGEITEGELMQNFTHMWKVNSF